jgi:hypothetical protein
MKPQVGMQNNPPMQREIEGGDPFFDDSIPFAPYEKNMY